eukprot:GDKI01000335.1.p1 GENE.GDKI01000335.1~~GDKI01000335.1.p1  ORF type:complete len:146 (-),score=30.38 GDKI01000335.1:352-789(-)
MFLSPVAHVWHYKPWQRNAAGFLRMFAKNRLPNNEMIGYVINDKHPKSIKVACDRYVYVVRYKKTFRLTKKVWVHDEDSVARMGDVVRVQPLGYRIGPWKNYVLVRLLHREPREADMLEAADRADLGRSVQQAAADAESRGEGLL